MLHLTTAPLFQINHGWCPRWKQILPTRRFGLVQAKLSFTSLCASPNMSSFQGSPMHLTKYPAEFEQREPCSKRPDCSMWSFSSCDTIQLLHRHFWLENVVAIKWNAPCTYLHWEHRGVQYQYNVQDRLVCSEKFPVMLQFNISIYWFALDIAWTTCNRRLPLGQSGFALPNAQCLTFCILILLSHLSLGSRLVCLAGFLPSYGSDNFDCNCVLSMFGFCHCHCKEFDDLQQIVGAADKHLTCEPWKKRSGSTYSNLRIFATIW